MSMSGYTKLFSSILDSTIWREDKETKIVWITMLAMVDKHGEIQASIPGLADRARVTIPECQEALAALMAPDEFSRTKDHDGRRVEEIEGGWLLLNYESYREKLSAEDQREKARLRKQRQRRCDKSQESRQGCDKSRVSLHAEADAEAEAEDKHKPTPEMGGGVEIGKPLVALETAKSNAGMIETELVELWWNSREASGWEKNGTKIKRWKPDLTNFAATYRQNRADKGLAPRKAETRQPAPAGPEPADWREKYEMLFRASPDGLEWQDVAAWKRSEITKSTSGDGQQ